MLNFYNVAVLESAKCSWLCSH